ncbi:hypothetical protein BKA93DRAFT_811033 [Sparassis latifolia]
MLTRPIVMMAMNGRLQHLPEHPFIVPVMGPTKNERVKLAGFSANCLQLVRTPSVRRCV